MIVRIQFRQGPRLGKAPGKNRHLALAGGALLIPVSLMAYVLGFWRLASDIGMTREFAIRGLFSHWQLWIVTAVTLQVAASVLNRYARGGEFHLPRVLTFRFGAVSPPPPDPENGDPGPRPNVRSAKASQAR
jgi:hypothetical protein